ncbi:MAG: hypothetical protein R3C01_08850 [Planctomycetaceae bacterium]
MKYILCWILMTCTVVAAEELPRVLILGDTSYSEPSRSIAKELKGSVEVVWKNPGDSSSALAQFDTLIGSESWDVIYFNFGLADLHYKDPKTTAIRAMSKSAGGVRVTSPEQYSKNLTEFVKRLKTTNAKLIWASTTPIRDSKFDDLYDPGSEIEYNAIAEKIMEECDVKITDMHTYVLANIGENKVADPFSFHRVLPLHSTMVESIFRELKRPEA